MLPAVASPDVIPAADNPTVPRPYSAANDPIPPIPAPKAPDNTSGIALSLIVLVLSFVAAAASLITLTTCCKESTL